MNSILTPFFDVVAEITMTTDIPLCVSITNYPDGMSLMDWYVGVATHPTHGSASDLLRLHDLDEDKLNDWVAELRALIDEPEDDSLFPPELTQAAEDALNLSIFNETQS